MPVGEDFHGVVYQPAHWIACLSLAGCLVYYVPVPVSLLAVPVPSSIMHSSSSSFSTSMPSSMYNWPVCMYSGISLWRTLWIRISLQSWHACPTHCLFYHPPLTIFKSPLVAIVTLWVGPWQQEGVVVSSNCSVQVHYQHLSTTVIAVTVSVDLNSIDFKVNWQEWVRESCSEAEVPLFRIRTVFDRDYCEK